MGEPISPYPRPVRNFRVNSIKQKSNNKGSHLEIPSYNQINSLKAQNVIFTARKPSDSKLYPRYPQNSNEARSGGTNHRAAYGLSLLSRDKAASLPRADILDQNQRNQQQLFRGI